MSICWSLPLEIFSQIVYVLFRKKIMIIYRSISTQKLFSRIKVFMSNPNIFSPEIIIKPNFTIYFNREINQVIKIPSTIIFIYFNSYFGSIIIWKTQIQWSIFPEISIRYSRNSSYFIGSGNCGISARRGVSDVA